MKPLVTVSLRYRYRNKQERGHDIVVRKGFSAVKVTVQDIRRPASPVVCFTYVEDGPYRTMVSLFKMYLILYEH